MELRIRATGQLFREDELRRVFISNVIPAPITTEWLNEFGADPVLEGPQPTVNDWRYEYVYRDGAEFVDGKWFTKYSIGPNLTGQELEDYKAMKDAERSAQVRSDRNRRLSETDWRFRSDLTPSQEWKDYCQALRDVPTQSGFPWEVQWPVQPE